MHGKNHAALMECADRLLRRQWHHDDQSLLDAEIELGVIYELFECDLEQRGELEQLLRLSEDAQFDFFFRYLQRGQVSEEQSSCLDEIPPCDWPMVWVKYLTNVLRRVEGSRDSMEQGIDLVSARLCWAILTSNQA